MQAQAPVQTQVSMQAQASVQTEVPLQAQTPLKQESGVTGESPSKEATKPLFENKTAPKNNNDATAIIGEKIKKLPASLLTAEADSSASTQTSLGGGMIRLTVPVTVSVNHDAYKIFVKDFNDTLKELKFSPNTGSILLKTAKDEMRISKSDFVGLALGKSSGNTRDTYFLAVSDLINIPAKLSKWTVYEVPQEIVLSFIRPVAFGMQLDLKNITGAVISSAETVYAEKYLPQNFRNTVFRFRPHSIASGTNFINGRIAVIAPLAFYHLRHQGELSIPVSETIPISVTVDLTEDELKSVHSIKCIINNVAL